jgi:hypothetical protein
MEHIFGGNSNAHIKDDETGIAAPQTARDETPQEQHQEEKTAVQESNDVKQTIS